MKLALGTVQFGLAYGISGNSAPVPDAEIKAILCAAHEAGIRRLDTAPAYGNIEERLASLCGSLDFEIVSKIPSMPPDLTSDELFSVLKQSVEQTKGRLGDRLCGLILHDPDILLGRHSEMVREALAKAVQGTRVRLGASHYSSETIPGPDMWQGHQMMQLPGNAYDQRIDKVSRDRPTVETSMRSVFLQGLLLTNKAHAIARVPAIASWLNDWSTWCDRLALTHLSAALSVAKSFHQVEFCLVGVDSMAQLAEIIESWQDSTAISAPELAATDPNVFDPRRWTN